MNKGDAEIRIHRIIWDSLNEMAIDDDVTAVEEAGIRESMEALTDFILENLGLEVVEVNADTGEAIASIIIGD